MANSTNLYTKVVEVSEEFLGPAGERFIRRQVQTHFDIAPESLQRRHLPELVDWIKLTFTMVTSDATVVNDFATKLLNLANSSSIKAGPAASTKS